MTVSQSYETHVIITRLVITLNILTSYMATGWLLWHGKWIMGICYFVGFILSLWGAVLVTYRIALKGRKIPDEVLSTDMYACGAWMSIILSVLNGASLWWLL